MCVVGRGKSICRNGFEKNDFVNKYLVKRMWEDIDLEKRISKECLFLSILWDVICSHFLARTHRDEITQLYKAA